MRAEGKERRKRGRGRRGSEGIRKGEKREKGEERRGEVRGEERKG